MPLPGYAEPLRGWPTGPAATGKPGLRPGFGLHDRLLHWWYAQVFGLAGKGGFEGRGRRISAGPSVVVLALDVALGIEARRGRDIGFLMARCAARKPDRLAGNRPLK